ncbi:unnamed protein product [Hapterophycus canaliculatus]
MWRVTPRECVGAPRECGASVVGSGPSSGRTSCVRYVRWSCVEWFEDVHSALGFTLSADCRDWEHVPETTSLCLFCEVDLLHQETLSRLDSTMSHGSGDVFSILFRLFR